VTKSKAERKIEIPKKTQTKKRPNEEEGARLLHRLQRKGNRGPDERRPLASKEGASRATLAGLKGNLKGGRRSISGDEARIELYHAAERRKASEKAVGAVGRKRAATRSEK